MPLFNSNINLDNNQLQNAVVHSGSSKPTSGILAGQIFYDTDVNQLQLYNGSAWEGVQTETADGALQFNTSLKIGRDSTDLIDFTTNNQITFRVNNGDGVIMKASGEIEATSLDIGTGGVDVNGTLEANVITIADTNILTGGIVTTLGNIAQDTIRFISSAADDPMFVIENTANDATGPRILLLKDRGAAAEDNDEVGEILFAGDNDAQEQTTYAKIVTKISDASNGAEGGLFEIRVASHDAELRPALQLIDGDAEDEVDAVIGSGAASVTTLAGTLTMGSTATINNSGVWVGSVIPSAKLDADTAHLDVAQTFGAAKTFGTTNKLLFRDAAIYLNSSTDGQLDIVADTEIQIAATTIDINGAIVASGEIKATSLDISGGIDVDGTSALAAVTATTGTFSGVLKTDSTTNATSTTDGSLQTDGGLSVALDAVIGDDLVLISDAAVLSLGAGKDVKITHDEGTGGTLSSAGNFVVDSTGGTLTLDGNSGVSIAGGSSEIDITTTGALDLNSGAYTLNSAACDIAASGPLQLGTSGTASHIKMSSAHGDGIALHIDANASTGAIVMLDAGILDINVDTSTTFDTTELKLGSAGGLRITDTTASSATEGAAINLVADDGAAMANNHRLGVINFKGAEDASNTLTLGASIEAFCDAGWSASENGTRLVFSTTDANNDTDIALTLDSNQKASFGADVAIAGNLTVAGTTTTENTTIIESTVTVLQFEGANDNDHETILKVVEPAADTTLSLPALSAGNFFIPAIAGAATDASAAVTAAEFALLDGGSTVGTTAISDNDGIVSNDAGTMRHTKVQTYQTYFDANSVGGGNIVTTGDLDSGTITAGFGAIDNGTDGIRTNIFTAETSFLPDADDGATLGSANLNFSDVFLADGAVLNFGDDQDVKLTHVADAGLLLNSTMKIQFNDASQFIQGSSATELQISATDQINLDSTLIDLNGNLDVSGTALVTGVLTVASNIVHADDTNNLIAFDTDTQSFQTGGTARINLSDSGLQIGSGARVTTIENNDSLGTSDTKLATQGNVKAYVDANTAASREVVLVLNASVDGVASTDNVTYAVTHGLSSRNVMVEVIRNGANSGDYRTVYVDVTRTSDDIVTIVFGSARTAGDYTVMIQKIG